VPSLGLAANSFAGHSELSDKIKNNLPFLGQGKNAMKENDMNTRRTLLSVAAIVAVALILTGHNVAAQNCASRPLFVSDFYNHEILIYASNSNGDATPVATIEGGKTRLSHPYFVTLDALGNLYVADPGNSSIEVFAPDSNGNTPPTSVIQGKNTGLRTPLGVAVGLGNIYVTDMKANSVFVYPIGSDGDVTPSATIAGSNTGLSAPSGITFDSAGNIYVANTTNTITVYAPGANGNTAPTRTISGGDTRLIDPDGLAFDAAGNLYVVNGGSGIFPPKKNVGSSITVYTPGAAGNASPIATISGNLTTLINPNGIALDSCGTIYVTDVDTASVVEFASGSNGNVLPIRVISGVDTELRFAHGIAIH
jgi:sugar lactone lactonase YvrE